MLKYIPYGTLFEADQMKNRPLKVLYCLDGIECLT